MVNGGNGDDRVIKWFVFYYISVVWRYKGWFVVVDIVYDDEYCYGVW